jgi:hypothetical protein
MLMFKRNVLPPYSWLKMQIAFWSETLVLRGVLYGGTIGGFHSETMEKSVVIKFLYSGSVP